MLLEGSCHCQAVKFSVTSNHPYPFNRCYCGICRKTAGAGGFVVNLSAVYDTLSVTGTEHIRVYQAEITDAKSGETRTSPAERNFCGRCGSQLWLWDPRWPDQLHPHASAIDTELPVPPEYTHLMLDHKASWVEPHIRPSDKTFGEYPEESIADWHHRLGFSA